MGEEGGRKPSLDNPEYFLFPEEAPAVMDRNPGNPASATMDKNPGEPPVMNRFFGQPATMDRLRGETATMDRRARTVSQVNNVKLCNCHIIEFKLYAFIDPSFQGGVIEELLPPTEIMESLERIESLGERAAKVMLLFIDVA